MSDVGLTARLLRREQWIIGACLFLIAALAWAWLLQSAAGMKPAAAGAAMPGMDMPGMDMSGMDMSGMDMSGMAMPAPAAALTGGYIATAFIMWLLMMTAMMLPSAAPMILLYARVARGVKAQGKVLAPTALFGGVYLAVWAAFSIVAALAQAVLVDSGLLSAAGLRLGDLRVAGALLIAAGLYQLTPLKAVCLESCRSPLSFLTLYWRPNTTGALRLGLFHGLYCLGCCWLVMGLLFVGGVMSLTWVAVLALVVLIEKAAPFGRQVGLVAGVIAMLAGFALTLGLSLPG